MESDENMETEETDRESVEDNALFSSESESELPEI